MWSTGRFSTAAGASPPADTSLSVAGLRARPRNAERRFRSACGSCYGWADSGARARQVSEEAVTPRKRATSAPECAELLWGGPAEASPKVDHCLRPGSPSRSPKLRCGFPNGFQGDSGRIRGAGCREPSPLPLAGHRDAPAAPGAPKAQLVLGATSPFHTSPLRQRQRPPLQPDPQARGVRREPLAVPYWAASRGCSLKNLVGFPDGAFGEAGEAEGLEV
jgi:hypothetical protein